MCVANARKKPLAEATNLIQWDVGTSTFFSAGESFSSDSTHVTVEPTKALPETRSRNNTKSGKAVRFAPVEASDVLEITRHPEDDAATWYTKADYEQIHASYRLTLSMLEEGRRLPRGHTARGLEDRTRVAYRERSAFKLEAYNAVLDEQTIQWIEDSDDVEVIRKIYAEYSEVSNEKAVERALKDEKEALRSAHHDTDSAPPRKKTVAFTEDVEVRHIEREDDEVASNWLTAKDYVQILKRCYKTIALLESGAELPIDDTSRGLEARTKAGVRKRRAVRSQAYTAVLDEQDRQWEKDCDDEEAIRDIYLQHSTSSANEAIFRGKLDERCHTASTGGKVEI